MITENYRELNMKIDEELQKNNERKVRKIALNIIRDRHSQLAKDPEINNLSDEFIKIKKYCLNNINLLKERAFKNLRNNGCKVYEVNSAKEAISIIRGLIKGNLLVKSKTNMSKEINLKKELEKFGINIIETDLGDRLVQLAGIPSAHPILPSLNISKEKAYELLTGKKLTSSDSISINDTVKLASKGLKEIILKAKVALTGANVITANEGFIGLVENEGNQRLITSLARIHIVITGIDKIVPTLKDALIVMKAASYYGLGTKVAGYFSFISGPSRTGDIESTICYGMHGPEEVHVIFIDNYRSHVIKSEYKEILECCSCGGCVNYCPVFEEIGGIIFGGTFQGGRGIILSMLIEGVKNAFEKGLNLCTTCKICTCSCPSKMRISDFIISIREMAVKEGFYLNKHKRIVTSILKFKNPFNEISNDRLNWIKKYSYNLKVDSKSDTLLFLGCMSSFKLTEQAYYACMLLDYLNIEYDYLGNDENCCGGLLFRLGFKNEFEQIMKENIQILKKYKRIILVCPGCYSTFINFYNKRLRGIEIKHLIELLDERQNLEEFLTNKKITYHDPCHLSRDLGIIEPPRNILKKLGIFEEMKMNSELSRCCGAGGGVLSTFPELSSSMAKSRLNDACLIKDLDYLLTTCPFCEYNLKNSKTNDMNFQIMSIQEFIINQLKKV